MKKVTVNILASDFENNSFFNMERENGCPMQRAFKRTGLYLGKEDFYNTSSYFKQEIVRKADTRVCRMFMHMETVEDFSFKVEV